MAIRTGEIFNSLIFGGVNSADYGVYITGEATFNAPKRLVEMVSVPGRNGSIAIDQGHWDNIVVEYPAGFFGSDNVDFREALSDFRNAIVSRLGYQRLTDTYHPDEYRMAMYIEGLEVEPVAHNTAGEFTLKFNCKPQRWLTSGEVAVTVASGDVLTNPTPYDAGPLLMAKGYGTISFNGYDVEIDEVTLGEVILSPSVIGSGSSIRATYKNTDAVNTGDTIHVSSSSIKFIVSVATTRTNFVKSSINVSDSSSSAAMFSSTAQSVGGSSVTIQTLIDPFTYTKGQFPTYINTVTVSGSYRYINTDNTTVTASFSVAVQIRVTITTSGLSVTKTTTEGNKRLNIKDTVQSTLGGVYADSTKSALGDPTYIDCEIGEAYMITDGQPYSLNQYISLGSDLPVLKSGANEITVDDTITELKIKPNWWKL